MKVSAKKLITKTLKITGITMGTILLLMFLLPFFFPDFVAGKIKFWVNSVITTKLEFSKARLSFFNHFPALTLTLYDASLMGAAPYAADTLVKAGEISLGIDLYSVFSSKLRIDEIYLTQSTVNIKVDENGGANYNVYKSDTTETTPENDTTGTSLKLEKIQIEKSNLIYNDLSIPILITAQDLNYTGNGDISKAIFDLSSHINIGTFNLAYDATNYIKSKKLKADLVTQINTNSLAFEFIKNDLLINTLPVDFTGKFAFLESGYNMDFELHSHKATCMMFFLRCHRNMPAGLMKPKLTVKQISTHT